MNLEEFRHKIDIDLKKSDDTALILKKLKAECKKTLNKLRKLNTLPKEDIELLYLFAHALEQVKR